MIYVQHALPSTAQTLFVADAIDIPPDLYNTGGKKSADCKFCAKYNVDDLFSRAEYYFGIVYKSYYYKRSDGVYYSSVSGKRTVYFIGYSPRTFVVCA